MPARVWTALAGLIVVLLVAVVGLDQWQARRGEASLFGLPWSSSPTPSVAPGPQPRRATGATASTATPQPAPPVPTGSPRVAVIVDDLGARRDVFDPLRDVRRPLTVAVLPGLPLSEWTAREAAQAGMEVLLDLPMEPYRYPEVDPGPGSLLMAMSAQELQRQVGAHLASVPGAVGVTNHMGSRMTEDRARMRTVGEAGDRVRWDEVAWWAERRGEAIVIVHGHPLTARLLREYLPRWEARGIRL